jgi:hypothetical protein
MSGSAWWTASVTNCKDVYSFLDAVHNRAVTTTLPAPDLSTLTQSGIVKVVNSDQYSQMSQDLATLDSGRAAIAQEMDARNRLSATVRSEESRTHSILFRLEGHDRRQAETDQESKDAASLTAMQADLTAKSQRFDALLAQRAVMDSLTPFPGGYVGLTGYGALQLRDLGVRLYRSSDVDFSAYWQETQQVDHDLNDIAERSSAYFAQLGPRLPSSDRSYLWAIAVGLAKTQGDFSQSANAFLSAYGAIGSLAHNDENRLLSAEILAVIPRPLADTVRQLAPVEQDVRRAGVPKESSLGVASLLLLAQRQDGTFALPELSRFLQVTRSYESAALLAMVNRPFDELVAKLGALRGLFASWGYQPSEDVELAASYLTLSDLPADGISTKLAILSRGLIAYLQYPLVASAILASIPVLEANETLNLLEHAYEIIGRRAMPMSQAELLCLAVRMVHGIRSETVGGLDSTAAAKPAGFTYLPTQRFFFVPIVILHGSYYSTFGGIGGAHPGHAHGFGGGMG